MKLAWVIGLLLLAISTAHSVPADAEEEPNNNQLMEDDNVIAERVAASNDKDEDNSDGDAAAIADDDNDEDQYPKIAAAKDTDLMDMAEYQKEVDRYLEQDKSNKNLRVKRQNNRNIIKSGDTIALQTFIKDHYLGCAGNPCRRAGCPKAHMTGNDWSRCWGEVFRIYKLGSPGPIRVGNMVGVYYPRENGKWLGCAGRKCGKAPCPSTPTMRFGFNTANRIHGCWGEVFRIYVKGKRNNALVNSNDEVSFYYVRGRQWVSQGYQQTTKTGCLGGSFPPSVGKYDGCAHETFTIWKRKGC